MSTAQALSSILGWSSIACWIVVYSPQIYENYSLQSGEGLSVLFVVVWLLGDLCNFVGAALGGLLPTVIILAIYVHINMKKYSLCDIILLAQVYYYRWKKLRTLPDEQDVSDQTPLLSGQVRPQETPVRVLALRYTAAVVFIFVTGVVAWWISGANDVEEDQERPELPTTTIKWTVQILGWSSAVLYLGARVPQIVKNFTTRCEGLSPALFFFAIFGNTTYAWSICAKSMEKDYLVTNASWLAGSALTVFLDVIVLAQFFYYRSVRKTHVVAENSS
ncbi:PQ-loop-domain-containing protein [Hymenopellis radicata]|nr:PQ-loop-domain-containing protein [Hymenopellis radicata]